MFTPKRTYTRAEVRRHNRVDDCWIIYQDKVYDVTKYLPTHPGGARFITDHAGEDVTYDFNDKPHTTKAKKILQVFCIGKVEKRVRGDAATVAAAAAAAAGAAAGKPQSPLLGGARSVAAVPPVPLFGAAGAAGGASGAAPMAVDKPAVRIDYSLVDNRNYNAPPRAPGHDRTNGVPAAAAAAGGGGGVAPMVDDPFRADFPAQQQQPAAAAAAAAAAAPAAGGGFGFAITLTAPGSSQAAAVPVQSTRSAAAIRLPDAVLNIAPPAAVAARNDAIAAQSAAAGGAAATAAAAAAPAAAGAGGGAKAAVAPGSIDAKDLISSLRAAQSAAKGAAGPTSLKPLQPLLVKGEITKRKKEPLEPGCSPLHWNELINRMPRRQMRKISRAELKEHNRIGDAWMALRGKVYDITEYVRFHPGGKTELMRGAGIDGTQLFDATHHWINIDYLLDKCMIGVLLG